MGSSSVTTLCQSSRQDLTRKPTINIASGIDSFREIKISVISTHLTFRREEIRIRKEEEKILEEILQDIKSLQKNNIPFTWTRCILETCLLGIYIHNLFLAPADNLQSTSGLQAVL